MLILTNDNCAYPLDKIPDQIEDIRYCVLDYSDRTNPDHFFIPLVFLESFYSPTAVLSINGRNVAVPLDWSMLVCDEEYSDMEVMPVTSLNDRGFHTLVYNPLKHMFPKPYEITITNIYPDVKWYFPKLKNSNILVVPIEEKECPDCILLVKDATRLPDVIDIGAILE